MRFTLIAVFLLLLSACVTDTPGAVKEMGGRVISSSGYEKINEEQSKIKYKGSRQVEERYYASNNEARLESIKIKGLPLFDYTALYGDRDWTYPPEQDVKNRLKSDAANKLLAKYGLSATGYTIEKRETKHGTAHYVLLANDANSCLLVLMRFGKRGWGIWSGGTSELRALGCGNIAKKADIEREVNRIFSEIDNLEFIE